MSNWWFIWFLDFQASETAIIRLRNLSLNGKDVRQSMAHSVFYSAESRSSLLIAPMEKVGCCLLSRHCQSLSGSPPADSSRSGKRKLETGHSGSSSVAETVCAWNHRRCECFVWEQSSKKSGVRMHLSFDWLIGLIIKLIVWLICYYIDWLIECRWLIDWSSDWLIFKLLID